MPALTRLGLSFVVLVLLGGLGASGRFLFEHHENRDGQPGFTVDDVRGAYHGVDAEAPMLRILRDGHDDPAHDAQLAAADRDALLSWLTGESLSQDYDNLDLGEQAPAEIIALSCLDCHARDAPEEARAVPLEYWDDVSRLAISRRVEPTDPAVLLASLHTHALGLGTLVLAAILLGAATGWPRTLVGILAAIAGAGLLVDLGSWLLARSAEPLVLGIVAGGAAFTIATAGLLLLVLADLWFGRVAPAPA